MSQHEGKTVPKEQLPSHIVGIGASAGGLEAIEQFIKNMASSTGLAFVIVQHLSPDYKSLMVELLSKYTDMPVLRIEDGMMTKKDHIYLIPPRKNLKLFHGRLILIDQERSEGQINLPIDIFFRSLAEDQAEKAIGIVLSGTGSDGTRGIRAIKENGGMTMAQSEESAKFGSMPKNAIDTGLVDFVLPPEAMSKQLLAYIKAPYAITLVENNNLAENDNGLARIFSLLRESNKVDFTHYKPSTIIRRVERRILINQCRGLDEYIDLLESNSNEKNALFQELLIGVTSFFRDESVFMAFKDRLLGELFEMAEENELRIWVAGCSTGEEAYSIAMLCAEFKEKHKSLVRVKIFATDVDQHAIEKAGIGVYPDSVSPDIPAHYLGRYFVHDDISYRISRDIREMVVFAQHNLLKDPPFTNINLVTCRNLLIYLQPVLQKKVLELFNFSLNPKGILILGSSESLGEMEEYFSSLEQKFKFFRSRGKKRLPGFAGPPPRNNWLPSAPRAYQENANLLRLGEERFYNRFIQELSNHNILPLTIIVNDRMEVTHIFGESGKFLRFSSGKVNLDISKVVIKELSIPVAAGLQKAIKTYQTINMSNIRTPSAGNANVNIRILPMLGKGGQENMFAVLINESIEVKTSVQADAGLTYNIGLETEQRINDLEQELQFNRENLQATVEELETSNEELQATNEELMASNEELQSTNEELQSVNEELYTVNAEFQNKITELTILNNDMDNLLDSTQIASLFLDENLEIRRFTPKFKEFFPILEVDIGRPINHLSMHIDKDIQLLDIVEQVAAKGKMIEREIDVSGLGWFLLRATPYQISGSVNAGVMLTIFDIDQLKQTQQALLQRTQRKIKLLAKVVKDAREPIIQFNANGAVLSWNQGAERLYGWSEEEALSMTMSMLFPSDSQIDFEQMIQDLLIKDSLDTMNLQRATKSGQVIEVNCDFTILTHPSDREEELIIASMEHASQANQFKLHEECVHCISQSLVHLESSSEALFMVDDHDKIIAWSKNAQALFGWESEEAMGMTLADVMPALDKEKLVDAMREVCTSQHYIAQTKLGAAVDVSVSALSLGQINGSIFRVHPNVSG